jgi:translocator protein
MEGMVLSPVARTPTRLAMALAGFLAAAFLAGLIGNLFTSPAIPEWYAGLEKPGFTPPSWVFGPAWTLLYILMAVAAWRVWWVAGFRDARGALALFFIQLALNAGWSVVFFGLRAPGWALLEIVLLWVAIAATTWAFFRHSRLAGALMVPYMAWVTFAAALNAAIWQLN